MDGAGCWSTVVCTPAERAALGLTAQSEWLLRCRLAAGHPGNHATDASSHPRTDRRLWLEWNDFDDRAQSLIERNPCRFVNEYGLGCLFFEGHGGPHYVAPTNGHAKPRPTPPPAPSAPMPAAPMHPAGPSSGERHVLPRHDRQPRSGVMPTQPPPMPGHLPPGEQFRPPPPQQPYAPPGRHAPMPQSAPFPQPPPAPSPRPPAVSAGPAFGEPSVVGYPQDPGAETVDAQVAGRHVMPEASAGRRDFDEHRSPAVTPSRRHRMPDGTSVPPDGTSPASPHTAARGAGGVSMSDDAIGDALNEVARALSKLADAIRARD